MGAIIKNIYKKKIKERCKICFELLNHSGNQCFESLYVSFTNPIYINLRPADWQITPYFLLQVVIQITLISILIWFIANQKQRFQKNKYLMPILQEPMMVPCIFLWKKIIIIKRIFKFRIGLAISNVACEYRPWEAAVFPEYVKCCYFGKKETRGKYINIFYIS